MSLIIEILHIFIEFYSIDEFTFQLLMHKKLQILKMRLNSYSSGAVCDTRPVFKRSIIDLTQYLVWLGFMAYQPF